MKRSLNDDREYLAGSIDTGQFPVSLDTGQSTRLEIISQDIHRTDNIADGTEVVMSTLRKFNLRVAVVEDGNLVTHEDGMKLTATLIFDNGNTVTDLSQSMEPPLLGGEAIVDNGEANFELRITVLSSLCRGNKFRIQVAAVDQPQKYRAMTGPMRTITKLHRTPVSKAKCQNTTEATNATTPVTQHDDLPLEWPISLLDEFGPADVVGTATEVECEVTTTCSEVKTREELWAEVTANGNLILELQSKQAALFQQLRAAISTASKDNGSMLHGDAVANGVPPAISAGNPLKQQQQQQQPLKSDEPPPLFSSASFTSALPEVVMN
eukprot:CAMPEP_0174710800 /NCGR_PEP_ID=MMETSP1094-20130205/12308_1 /TAXON_ID=156173 /ORGANISM="Chrysochromulina brevifilum, Strain UTEX LB 985" /LENGTH=323 /DNA_ID=CAMNT_0015909649 /DNA_START=59 /DNA_END=1030 /DNA_ORIENTATION=-